MARRLSARSLRVFANQRLVGELNASGGGRLEFRYASSWLSDGESFPLSLSLPLSERSYTSRELEPFLDNPLPDEEGVRRALAARVRARGTDPFSLLWELGRDCVGALQAVPADEEPTWHSRPEGTWLQDVEIAEILSSLGVAPLGVSRGAEFRISVAGAQEKTSLLRTPDGWFKPTGTTPSTHILKPSIGHVGALDLSESVENEYLCLKLVAELGLPAATVTVEHFAGAKALVVERFDRAWMGSMPVRLPQEDVCQALGVPSFRKYDADGGPGMRAVLELLLQSDEPALDRKLFLQACFVYWLIGATDGHAKNFSLALGAQGGFRLTPSYDVMSLQPQVDRRELPRREYRVAMAVGDNRHYKVDEIMPRHFVQTAEAAGVHARLANEWLGEIVDMLPVAVASVSSAIGNAVPEGLFDSIVTGARTRAELLA